MHSLEPVLPRRRVVTGPLEIALRKAKHCGEYCGRNLARCPESMMTMSQTQAEFSALTHSLSSSVAAIPSLRGLQPRSFRLLPRGARAETHSFLVYSSSSRCIAHRKAALLLPSFSAMSQPLGLSRPQVTALHFGTPSASGACKEMIIHAKLINLCHEPTASGNTPSDRAGPKPTRVEGSTGKVPLQISNRRWEKISSSNAVAWIPLIRYVSSAESGVQNGALATITWHDDDTRSPACPAFSSPPVRHTCPLHRTLLSGNPVLSDHCGTREIWGNTRSLDYQ